MYARDLMTPEPAFSLPDDTPQQIAREMRDLDVGIIPVVNDPDAFQLEGVITDRDLVVRHVAQGCEGCTASDHMTTDGVAAVNPDTDAEHVMAAMKEHQVRRVPVIDDDHRLLGIIAQADLATELGDEQPEEVEDVVEAIST